MDLLPVSSLLRELPKGRSPEEILRRISKKVGILLGDYPDMIAEGDKIMVCISGGKDSYALLDVLIDLRRRAPVRFELVAVNIDQGWPGYETSKIAEHLQGTGVAFQMVDENYATIVEEKLRPGQTPCSLCSRFRRGVLYNLAEKLGCTKIALGHHADDLVETLLMNLFFSGRLASMPPILFSDDGRNTVIRPMALVPEALLIDYCQAVNFPVVRCGCPSCGLPEQKRQVVKAMLGRMSEDNPQLKGQMLAALRNVVPSHLMDPRIARALDPAVD